MDVHVKERLIAITGSAHARASRLKARVFL